MRPVEVILGFVLAALAAIVGAWLANRDWVTSGEVVGKLGVVLLAAVLFSLAMSQLRQRPWLAIAFYAVCLAVVFVAAGNDIISILPLIVVGILTWRQA